MLSNRFKNNLKALVVDDTYEAAEVLKVLLERGGARVITAYSGAEALRATFQHRPDVVLLDIMMPEMDGFTTCQRLRELSDVPIIIVSALGQIEDITKALKLGADDYLVKPYDGQELLARVQACLRRAPKKAEAEAFVVLGNGELVIDTDRHRVLVRQHEVRLTKTEFNLLHYLALNRGRVLTYGMILEAVWGNDAEVNWDTLKQFVLSLRKKIERDPRNPRWLVNERGVGYALVID